MKKRNRNRNLGKQRRTRKNAHRPRLEDLEPRRLLAGDLVLGPGNVDDIDRVGPTASISELELADDAPSIRVTNDTFETAERLNLGFGEGQFTGIDVQGELIEPTSIGGLRNIEEPALPNQAPPVDDGSILLANRVNHQTGNPIRVDATVQGLGNSLRNGTADGDFYEFEDLEAGQVLTAHLDIPLNGFVSSGVLVLYNQFGQVQQVTNALDPSRGFGDAYMNWTVETDGDYYIAVIPYNTADTFLLPDNPFRDSTVDPGALTGNVPYTLTLGVDAVDVDYYAIDLNPGDIFGVSSIGAGNLLSLYDADQNLVMRSGTDHSLDYPSNSPLPQGGSADLAFVASEAGTYYLAVEGYEWARYLLETRVFRPAIESAPQGTRQILFLDFDGAEITPEVFGSGEVARRELSPLSSFLPGWDLNVRDESELIDKIVEIVDSNLNERLQSENPDAGVIVLNSRDHADPFGSPYVSRVVVGGTAGQSTFGAAIGLANSLDVGNFDLEEDSFLVLDTLISGNTLGANPFSLNTFQLADGFSRVDVVAAGIGGMVSHEAGHFFGAYHTDSANDVASLMDAGGPQAVDAYLGVGQDRIFGTADDEPVTFAVDLYAHDEGSYFGINNTPGSLANVLISGKGVGSVEGVGGMTVSGSVFNDVNANGVADTNESGVAGVEVFIDLNHDRQFSIGEPAAVTNSAGTYTIAGIPGVVGTLDIYAVTTEGQSVTFPAEGGYAIAVGSAIPVNASFGITGEVGAGSGLDLSDAPESYGVASHEVQSTVSLGPTVDPDDTTAISDLSDDGVSLSNVVAGGVASGTATANTGDFASGVLNGWLDFNQDGTFSDSERIVSNQRFSGTTTFSFPVPEAAVSGTTWARFRYGYIRDVAATGASGVGEVEDYPVIISVGTNGGGDGGGTTITAPFANNDTFTVSADQASVLALLGNDSNGSDPNTRIDSVGTSAAGGTIQIDAAGQTVTYTPAAGFIGADSFTYSIANSVGNSSASVSVTVAGDGGPIDNGGDLVLFRLEVTDLAGAPITNIASGEDFLLRAYTDDLRDGGAGVYAAYLDVEFDADIASATGPVAFGPEYPAGQTPMGGVIVNGTADGELDDFGAFAGFTNEIGEEERLLFSVPMNASQDGTVVFTSNPADNLPLHEVLLFDIAQQVPSTRIDYGTVTLTIGDEVEPVAAFTNPVNSRDVNDDGVLSPRDALIVINALNSDGAGPLSRATAAVSNGFFVDVNGDDNLSALDALMIINALNNPAGEPAAAGEPDDGAIAAAAVDAAFDTDDEEDDLFA